VIVKSNSIGPLYTMRLPGSVTPSSCTVVALAATPTSSLLLLQLLGSVVLVTLTLMTYLACLGHVLLIVPAINMICVLFAREESLLWSMAGAKGLSLF
jgi:hypothetical protein